MIGVLVELTQAPFGPATLETAKLAAAGFLEGPGASATPRAGYLCVLRHGLLCVGSSSLGTDATKSRHTRRGVPVDAPREGPLVARDTLSDTDRMMFTTRGV